ncbi:1,5-anhydro-D-fructose reductase-like [Mya arenaria]|uniref:1,5-anhydro-D-fructose reductase-like n=1 Tax=Mya arenaria TaxID=6604 RepID=UPI0022E2602F|nr:1,5-anhydro-D-fructose reductase-like [Mya arenaria]XP_052802715.1 1,5-anhydro-D-fructose reductase-like [Mya arenaria]
MSKTVPIGNASGIIPVVGLGTWTVFGQQGNSDEVERATLAAIDAGYRHIDCAWNYGTQPGVGKALEAKIKEGVIKREDMFLTTKLWDTHHNPCLVIEELRDSLRQLKTDYVDLFLIHWPTALKDQDMSGETICPLDENGKGIPADHKLEDVWKAVEECQKAGLTKHIGLSNFNKSQVTRILNSCSIRPVASQVEVSPYFSNRPILDFCKEKGMTLTAYAPLGAPNRPWHESGQPGPVFDEPILKEISASKGKSIPQVILRFHIQRGLVVIPKSITPSRIKENIDVFDFQLSEEEMTKIASLDRNFRAFAEPIASNHREYPFNDDS